MTKTDGDRLRAMKTELVELASDYGKDGTTGAGLLEIGLAIDLTLRGVSWEARRTHPKTGAIMPRHS